LRDKVAYAQLETFLVELKELGFVVPDPLISAAAFTFHRDQGLPPLLASGKA
jgi:hypothetical protein